MDVAITPTNLTGTVSAPPSKSAAHRAFICAALADGESTVTPIAPTDDMRATIGASCVLGAQLLEDKPDRCTVRGITASPDSAEIDCNESGSTLRFFVPIAAALGVPTRFFGRGNLPLRPLTPLTDALEAHGVTCNPGGRDGEILSITGRLASGTYTLPGDVSSQYITGLLFALPLLEGGSEIELTTSLQSKGYVDLTLQALADAGIMVEETAKGWRVPGNQRYRPAAGTVEGDYSGAAFWLCAAVLGRRIEVRNLRPDSRQGDRAVIEILRRFGATCTETRDGVAVEPGELVGTDIDAADIPDLVPVLAVVAACAQGRSTIYGAARLRIKESDRLHTISEGLRILGAQIEEREDSLVITGRERLRGGAVDSFADHRIAMALSVASIRCERGVTVTGAECVRKSYQNFYDDFKALGGRIDGIELG